MSLDYSDSYLYWDNAETATVVINQIWDTDSGAYVPETYAGVTVRRVSADMEDPIFNGLELIGDMAVFLVPAALVENNKLTQGDTIQVGSEVWAVSGNVHIATVGGVKSHFRCACFLQRG